MANTLLDIIREKMKPQAADAPVQLGQGEQAENLLRTKLTGKAQPATGGDVPKRSRIGETTAATQTQAELGQVAKESAIQQEQQSQQAADQTQAMGIFRQQEQQERAQRANQFSNQTASILNEFKSGQKRLSSMKDIGDLEAVAQGARFANKKYIDDLTMAAARASLDDDAKFQEQYYKNVFADQQDLFQTSMDWNNLMNAQERDFLDAMANLDLNTAYQTALNAAKAENIKTAGEGTSKAISGGLKAYQAAKTPSATPTEEGEE